jgi:ketosteroid isomerase-like protein
MTDAQSKVETLQAVMAALTSGDVTTALTYFADDCVFEMHRGMRAGGRRLVGKTDIGQALAAATGRFANARYVDVTHWVCGDRGVSEWTLLRVTPRPEKRLFRGCDLWDFRDGLISRRDSFRKIRPDLKQGDA